jgi:hypothetical protein
MSTAIPLDSFEAHYRTVANFLRSVFSGQESGILALFSKPSMVSYFAHLD